jgi:hypothetical protein
VDTAVIQNSRVAERAPAASRTLHLGKPANFKTANAENDVRFGSKADVTPLDCDVRFAPESGHSPTRSGCPLWARSRHRVISVFIEILIDRQIIFQYLLKYENA